MIYKSYLQYTISKFVKEPQESEKRRTASSYDVYDVINSPFLEGLRELPVEKYYVVEGGNEDLDIIAQKCYGSAFLAYYIQFYNDMETEYATEGSKIKLFSPDALNTLVNDIYTR